MRLLKILVAAGVVAVAGVGTSAPAMAAANPSIVSVTCDSCVVPSVSAQTIVANPGDTFTVHAGAATTATFELKGQSVSVGANQSASMTAPSAVGSYDFVVRVPAAYIVILPLTVTNAPVAPAHADGSTPQPPQPIIGLQQVGVPASGDCADVPASVGHDQGFPIGGWSKSWANWINNGTGGPVCTRTVEEIPNGPGTYRLVVNP